LRRVEKLPLRPCRHPRDATIADLMTAEQLDDSFEVRAAVARRQRFGCWSVRASGRDGIAAPLPNNSRPYIARAGLPGSVVAHVMIGPARGGVWTNVPEGAILRPFNGASAGVL
jgi:hypothetical protein